MVLKRGDLSELVPSTLIQTHREATLHGDLSSINSQHFPSLEGGMKIWEGVVAQYIYSLEDQLMRTQSQNFWFSTGTIKAETVILEQKLTISLNIQNKYSNEVNHIGTAAFALLTKA
ncbi:unnamed protein product [Phytophthora lilii]|uniref:Unnamed protein product n=1 Tax=Phytophthora lilii TaxID=2077276 RepID=A0A9W6TGN7_9STRA|nr:unnamed protein product [Phytophthora lilii]